MILSNVEEFFALLRNISDKSQNHLIETRAAWAESIGEIVSHLDQSERREVYDSPDLTRWGLRQLVDSLFYLYPPILRPNVPSMASESPQSGVAVVKLPEFRRNRIIEKGGYGFVWEAVFLSGPAKESLFALKILRTPNGDTRQNGVIERLQSVLVEAQYQTLKQHPNIVRILFAGEIEPNHEPAVAMDLVSGINLAQWRNGYSGRGATTQAPGYQFSGLTPSEKLKSIASLILLIGKAAAHIHACGLVHRDIKPENVLGLPLAVDNVAKTFDPANVKLGDLGLISNPSICNERPRPELIAGTPMYMAPEQLKAQFDARSDVFALARLFLFLLEGAHQVTPDCDRLIGDLILQVKSVSRQIPEETIVDRYIGVVCDPSQFTAIQDGGLRQILLKALNPDPNARYVRQEYEKPEQACERFCEDLELWINDFPTIHCDFKYTSWQRIKLFLVRCRRPHPKYLGDHFRLSGLLVICVYIPTLLFFLGIGAIYVFRDDPEVLKDYASVSIKLNIGLYAISIISTIAVVVLIHGARSLFRETMHILRILIFRESRFANKDAFRRDSVSNYLIFLLLYGISVLPTILIVSPEDPKKKMCTLMSLFALCSSCFGLMSDHHVWIFRLGIFLLGFNFFFFSLLSAFPQLLVPGSPPINIAYIMFALFYILDVRSFLRK